MAVATSTGSRAKMAAAGPGGTFCSTCAAKVGCGREDSVRLRVVRTKPISSNKRRQTPAVATLDGAPRVEGRATTRPASTHRHELEQGGGLAGRQGGDQRGLVEQREVPDDALGRRRRQGAERRHDGGASHLPQRARRQVRRHRFEELRGRAGSARHRRRLRAAPG